MGAGVGREARLCVCLCVSVCSCVGGRVGSKGRGGGDCEACGDDPGVRESFGTMADQPGEDKGKLSTL